MKTVYLFQVTSSQSGSEETARWWVDMKVPLSLPYPSPSESLLTPSKMRAFAEERSSTSSQTLRESTFETRSDDLPIRQRSSRTSKRFVEPDEVVRSEASES